VKKNSPQRDGVCREIEEFFNQELFTPRPEPVLSEIEGRLRGAISIPVSKTLKTPK
jgi:hypothetical protein